MSEKSPVRLAQRECIICGTHYGTGEILLDKRMRQSMDRYTLVGNGICPEHQKLIDDGFVLLVEATERNGDTYRTGTFLQVKRTAWPQMFNTEAPPKGVAFITPDVVAMIKARMP
jgi:hypothetical protein